MDLGTSLVNSLIFKVKLLGVFSALLISLMTYFSVEYAINKSKGVEVTRSIMLYKALQPSVLNIKLKSYLKKNNLQEMKQDDAINIISKSSYLIETPIYRDVFQSGNIGIYVYEDYHYYHLKLHGKDYYFKNLEKSDNTIMYIFIAVSFLLVIFVGIALYIIKAIKPLKNLHKKIHVFANKSDEFNNEHFGHRLDEVTEVSLAFDDAKKRIQSLQETRTLFWHNVMHELKTPITQGLLLTHFISDTYKDKDALVEVFRKMQRQLDKLKQLEYIKADSIDFEYQRVAMRDIIDDIQDTFYIEDNALFYTPNEKLFSVNVEYFMVALKNIILNAITYSDNKKVYLQHKNNHLYIINSGLKLEKPFNFYTQAFTRSEKTKSGMGLGLYIAKEIFLKHDIDLRYKYFKKHHLIILDLKNVTIN